VDASAVRIERDSWPRTGTRCGTRPRRRPARPRDVELSLATSSRRPASCSGNPTRSRSGSGSSAASSRSRVRSMMSVGVFAAAQQEPPGGHVELGYAVGLAWCGRPPRNASGPGRGTDGAAASSRKRSPRQYAGFLRASGSARCSAAGCIPRTQAEPVESVANA